MKNSGQNKFEYNLSKDQKELNLTLGVHLRINANYTATVRNLQSLINYLSNTGDIDKNFGIIDNEDDDITKNFTVPLVRICRAFNKFVRAQELGNDVMIFRNQAERTARVVATSESAYLVEYSMPKGTTALNVIRDLSNPDSYSTITYESAKGSHEWGKELDGVELIERPQRSKYTPKRRK